MKLSRDAKFLRLEAEAANFQRSRNPCYLRDVMTSGCFVYGAGAFGQRLIAMLLAQGFPCHGIIDRKFKVPGHEIAGVPALHPDSLRHRDAQGRCLLIGVNNQNADLSEIITFGKRNPFREILYNADLPDALGTGINNYWLGDRQFIIDHLPRLRAAIARLDDDLSFDTALNLFRYRITGNVEVYPNYEPSEQYLPSNLLAFEKPITFVDGGAFDGDTFSYLQSNGVSIHRWVAFEPDPGNFEQLVSFARRQSCNATLFPCGLSNRFMHVPFVATGGTASHLGEQSTHSGLTVACLALDDVIPGSRPDYIKLDIEGAEHAALLGMRKTIADGRPAIAVSAYHRPEDIWEIIDILTELAPYAKLHIRQHQRNGFETVVYAI